MMVWQRVVHCVNFIFLWSKINKTYVELDCGKDTPCELENLREASYSRGWRLLYDERGARVVHVLFIWRYLLCPGQIGLPPSPARGHHFCFGCPGLFITFFLPWPALTNHFNTFIFQCPALFHFIFQSPALFYHTHFSSNNGAARGDGRRTIWQMHYR